MEEGYGLKNQLDEWKSCEPVVDAKMVGEHRVISRAMDYVAPARRSTRVCDSSRQRQTERYRYIFQVCGCLPRSSQLESCGRHGSRLKTIVSSSVFRILVVEYLVRTL